MRERWSDAAGPAQPASAKHPKEQFDDALNVVVPSLLPEVVPAGRQPVGKRSSRWALGNLPTWRYATSVAR